MSHHAAKLCAVTLSIAGSVSCMMPCFAESTSTEFDLSGFGITNPLARTWNEGDQQVSGTSVPGPTSGNQEWITRDRQWQNGPSNQSNGSGNQRNGRWNPRQGNIGNKTIVRGSAGNTTGTTGEGNAGMGGFAHSSAATSSQTPPQLNPTSTGRLAPVFGRPTYNGLAPTRLDSFVKTAGERAEMIYGDEGSDGLPPYDGFTRQHRIASGIVGQRSQGLTTGHGSRLPSAWGFPSEISMSAPNNVTLDRPINVVEEVPQILAEQRTEYMSPWPNANAAPPAPPSRALWQDASLSGAVPQTASTQQGSQSGF